MTSLFAFKILVCEPTLLFKYLGHLKPLMEKKKSQQMKTESHTWLR
jgi:hypothetical protein